MKQIVRNGKLTKEGMRRANLAHENGCDCITIAVVMEIDVQIIVDFLNR